MSAEPKLLSAQLNALSEAEHDAYKSYVPGREADRANPYIEGKSDAYEHAAQLATALEARHARVREAAEVLVAKMDELMKPLIQVANAADIHGFRWMAGNYAAELSALRAALETSAPPLPGTEPD